MRKMFFSTITILIFCMVFTFNFNLHAFMFGNEGQVAYCGGNTGIPCPTEPSIKTAGITSSNEDYAGPTIRELIILGGGSMLKSSRYINAFFSKIELSELSESGPDYKELNRTIMAAIYHMEKARTTYFQLKTLASVTPYNQEVIYMLINFDYDAFQNENGLFPYVFARVEKFLSVGDVTGVFNEFYLYTSQILDLMYNLKRDIDASIFPNLSTVWRVNQKYSEFKLFGQYTAQIFYSIADQTSLKEVTK